MSLLLTLLGGLCAAAGLLALGFGIPVKEFSIGNTMIIAGAISLGTGFLLVGLAAAVRELRRLGNQLEALAPGRLPSATMRPSGFPKLGPLPEFRSAPKDEAEWLPHDLRPSSAPAQAAPLPWADREQEDVPVSGESPVSAEGSSIETERQKLSPESAVPEGREQLSPRDEKLASEHLPREHEESGAPPSDLPSIATRFGFPSRRGAARSDDSGGASPFAATRPSRSERKLEGQPTEAPVAPRHTIQEAPVTAPGGDASPASDQGAPFDEMWPSPSEDSTPAEETHAAPAAAETLSHRDEQAPATAPAEQPVPVRILKSGVVEGMAYTLYSDGSIEAQLADGVVRFASIDELRLHLDQR